MLVEDIADVALDETSFADHGLADADHLVVLLLLRGLAIGVDGTRGLLCSSAPTSGS